MSGPPSEPQTQPCNFCGSVLEIGQLVQFDEAGQAKYACEACAVKFGKTDG